MGAASALQREPFSVVTEIRLGVFAAMGELADVGEVGLNGCAELRMASNEDKRRGDEAKSTERHFAFSFSLMAAAIRRAAESARSPSISAKVG